MDAEPTAGAKDIVLIASVLSSLCTLSCHNPQRLVGDALSGHVPTCA